MPRDEEMRIFHKEEHQEQRYGVRGTRVQCNGRESLKSLELWDYIKG
jgi:hypothetical protein